MKKIISQGYFLYPQYEMTRSKGRPLLSVCHIAFTIVLPFLLSLFWTIDVFHDISRQQEAVPFS